MSDVLGRLRELNRREVKLEDGGLIVGYHLPDIQECLLAGDIPLPVLNHLPEGASETDVATAVEEAGMRDVILSSLRFHKRLVAAMLEDVDGVALAPGDDREAIVDAFTPAQREELLAIAKRDKDPDSGEA